jgi:hypothetical protein
LRGCVATTSARLQNGRDMPQVLSFEELEERLGVAHVTTSVGSALMRIRLGLRFSVRLGLRFDVRLRLGIGVWLDGLGLGRLDTEC